MDPAEQMIRKADRNLSQYLKEPVYAVSTALSTDLPYTGQHTSLKGGNNPIAFSRFSEHTTELPGMGEVKGIYVNELQSDMLDDLRKMGKRGGNKEQDQALALGARLAGEEGLVVGGIYYRVQVAHLKLCASRAFWLVAYPSQGHEMLFDAHARAFAFFGGVPRRGGPPRRPPARSRSARARWDRWQPSPNRSRGIPGAP